MFLKFRCGHLEHFGKDRTAHQRSVPGICYKCKRRNRLVASLITVEVRRRLIVEVEEEQTTIHKLAHETLRRTR